MSSMPLPPPPFGYHGAVSEFKRRLIEATLRRACGNRTHAAKALGLQRTYLLRLIRDLRVAAPPRPSRRRNGGPRPGDAFPLRRPPGPVMRGVWVAGAG